MCSDVAGSMLHSEVCIKTTDNDTAVVETEIVKAKVEITFVNDVRSECKSHDLKVSIGQGSCQVGQRQTELHATDKHETCKVLTRICDEETVCSVTEMHQ